MTSMLKTLYGYHAWANADLLEKLEEIDAETHEGARHTALRLISHAYVVSRIFAAHLQGVPHQFASDNLDETPSLDELRFAVLSSDQWYLDYIRDTLPSASGEAIDFTFTDGDKGFMTREEMLLHVACHAALHRGEVCRILSQLSIMPPWETMAVYLHQSQPQRRLQGMAATETASLSVAG